MIDSTQLENEPSQFTGTEHWYKHTLNRSVMYTDGVQYFANTVGAYWLLDIIATEPVILKTMREGLAVIELRVDKDSTAVLTCTDGDYNTKYTRIIEFTDAPVGVWQFFFTNDVILLPSEY